MALSTAEIESVRHHLGYGQLDVGSTTYTADGFKELFDQVVNVYLTGSTETTGSTATTAGNAATVTVASITGIAAHAQLVVDVGDDIEIVNVKSVSGLTFTARFAKAHTASYPVAVMGGHARVRILLHQADKAWQAVQSQNVGASAGLKQVDKGDVEWFPGGQVLKDRLKHYQAIVGQISSLVRVPPAWTNEQSSTLLEAY